MSPVVTVADPRHDWHSPSSTGHDVCVDADTHVVWGIVRGRTTILAVTTDPDGFTVASSADEAAFVAAADIVGVERGERHAGSGYVLRIEHTTAGTPSPIGLVLTRRHPVRQAIEGLRPELVTGALPTPWWRSGVTVAAVIALAVVLLGLTLL